MTDVRRRVEQGPDLAAAPRVCSIAAVVFVVLLVTVLSDLPVSTSRADDISAERSVMSEVNTDLGRLRPRHPPGHRDLEPAGRAPLTAADRAPTPGLLSDDQTACSFTNESIFDLTNIQVPGTPAGKDLGQMIATATLWTTSDALQGDRGRADADERPADASALRTWPTRRNSSPPTVAPPSHRRMRRTTPSTRTCPPSTCLPSRPGLGLS